MIKSMTGFGSASVQKKGYCVFSQVSSVNRGHLDIDISFNGKEYLFLLPEIRELVKKTVKRGKVNIHLHIEPLDQSKTVVFNENLARTILKKLRQWEKDSFSSASLRASDILHHEGVLTIKTSQAKTSVLKQLTSISLKKSLSEMDRLRLQEGRHIQKDFLRGLSRMEHLLLAIEKQLPVDEKHYEQKLAKRVHQARKTSDITIEEQNALLKMLGLFTEKTDISEEISRLKSHICQFRLSLKKDDKPGKTLNFIAQEMLREANTMGSKSPFIQTKKNVIAIKTVIEEIKEQVSNVE